MSQDILDPKDERDLAKEREVKPIKSPGGVSRPPSTPTMGEAEPTAGTPAPTQGATGTTPMQQQAPSQMVDSMANQLMFQTPSFQTSGRVAQLSGEEVRLQKDPLEIVDQGIQEQLGQLTPQSMFQGLQRSSFTPQLQTELPDDWEDKQDIVERAIGDVKVKNMNITQAHQYGYNPANVGRYGVSNAPALDTDLASRGLSSELGKAIEDKLSLDSVLTGEGVPVIGTIGGMWRDVTKSVLGIGLGISSWAESKMPEWYRNKVQAVRKKLGIDDDLERFTREQVEHLQSQTTAQKFDPSKQSFGDYGSGGTGALLYGLNVIPSAVMGGAYDLIDFGRELAGADELYAGSRTLDAFIKGKDWGLSNQWSEEKYLSLQEPSDLAPGVLTGNPYWDLPEKVAKMTGLNTRAAHWLIQAPLAIAGEALIDIPADRIAAKLGRILPTAKTPANKVAEEIAEAVPRGGELVVYNPTPFKPDEFVRTEVKGSSQILYVTPNGQVRTTIKDSQGFLRPRLPNGLPSYADVINTKPKTVFKPVGDPWSDALAQGDVPVSALSLMRRSDGEMAELARLTPSPLYKDNRPLLPPASRIPSANELKALELTIPEFKRYGSVTELVPSGAYDVGMPEVLPRPSLMLESVEDAMKRRAAEAAVAVQSGNVDALTDAYRAMEQSQIELAVIKARHLDSLSLYDTIKKQLPTSLQTDNVDLFDEAQVFLQSDFNITVLGNRKRQVEGEISLLNDKIREIDGQLQVYGDIGRGDISVVKRTEGWSDDGDEYVDELSFDIPEEEPGQILTDVTDPQDPQPIDFGTPQKDAEAVIDDIASGSDDFDPEAEMYETRDDIPFGMDDEEDPYAGFYGTDEDVPMTELEDDFSTTTPDVPEDGVDELTFDLPEEETTTPVQTSALDDVLSDLYDVHDNYIPASEIGKRLGVSKDEMWKELHRLQREGKIEVYLMSDVNPDLSNEDIDWAFNPGIKKDEETVGGYFYVQLNEPPKKTPKPSTVTLGEDDIDDLSPDFDEQAIPDIEETREVLGETTATQRIDSMEHMSDLELTPDEDWNYIMGYVTQILKDNDGKWSHERYLRNIASEEPMGEYDEALIRALSTVPDGATADDVRRVVDSVPQPPDWETHLANVKAENAKALEGIRADTEARRAEYRERGREILGKYADYVNLDDLVIQHEKFEPFIKKVIRPTLESIEELTGGWIPRVDITSWEARSAFRPEGAYDNAVYEYVEQLPTDYIGKVSFGISDYFMEPGKWDSIKAALFHEIGHSYEYSHPKYRQWATEYRQWLVDQGLVIDASNIDYATQDSWTGDRWLAMNSDYRNPYVGRTYPNGSTEVVSTIFEYFSDRDTTIYFKTKNPTLYELGVRIFEDATGKPFNVNDVYPKSRAATVLGRGEYEAADAVGKGMKQKTTISGKYLLEWEDFAENKRWMYGTPNPVLIENMDYMKGGSTSELGFGVYLTTDKKMAAKSATKFPMSNQPENLRDPNQFHYKPTVYDVNPGMLDNVMDLSQPIPKGNFRKMLEEAAKFATGDKAFAPHAFDGATKIAFIWNKFRENYLKYYGKSASEGVVRKYYEYIANSFKNWNIDAGYFSNNGVETMIVYNPKNLINMPTPAGMFLDPMSQANVTEYRLAAQQYIDSQVLRQFGDDVSKVNWLTSNRDLAEWLKRKHQKSLAEIQADLMDEIELNMNAEEALRYGVEDEVYRTIESFKENLDTRTINEFNIDSNKINKSPCPPMTANFFKIS